MLVRVKHNELNSFAKTTDNNANDLANEIEFMLSKINELSGIWQGYDADKFYENAKNYLNKMKLISHTMNVFGEFTRRTDRMYVELDTQFAKKMQQEVNYDE